MLENLPFALTPELIFLIATAVVALIIGYLIAWLFGRAETKRVRGAARESEARLQTNLQRTHSSLNDVQTQLSEQQLRGETLAEDKVALQAALAEARRRFEDAEEQAEDLQNAMIRVEQERNQLESIQQQQARNIDSMQAELSLAQQQVDQLTNELDQQSQVSQQLQAELLAIHEAQAAAAAIDEQPQTTTVGADSDAAPENEYRQRYEGTRSELQQRTIELSEARAHIAALSDDVAILAQSGSQIAAELAVRSEAYDALESKLRTEHARVSELSNRLASAPVGVGASSGDLDDFEKIRGIGKVYKGKLYEAGILTFADLARCSEERLTEVGKGAAVRKPDFASWIEQAAQFAHAGG